MCFRGALAWVFLAAALSLAAVLAQEAFDPREEARRQKQLLLETAGILPTELIVEEGRELFYRTGPAG